MNSSEISLQRNLRDVVAEYDQKLAAVDSVVSAFKKAGDDLKSASIIGGVWGDVSINVGDACERTVKSSLLRSAWKHVYEGLNIARISTPSQKKKWEQDLASPAPFTLENIRATFGDYIRDPRANILRGLAEVFCRLDPAYKSHDKVKIGVNGLPKRIIVSISDYSNYTHDMLESVLNALAAMQGKPLVAYAEINALLKKEDALLKEWEEKSYNDKTTTYPARGVSLRRFKNGNGHLFFEPDTLRDINLGLAEYYGEVLPDCTPDGEEDRPVCTAVSKDLQYYPTPLKVVQHVLDGLPSLAGERILEPSCGCGRFMDAIRDKGAFVYGVEYHAGRAELCRSRGHAVFTANFLETVPTGDFDRVIMNPPFYGKHYAKHVNHAHKFLRKGGTLTAILPATARYDHGLLDGRWDDLPVGSFSESGTNINTTILTMRA